MIGRNIMNPHMIRPAHVYPEASVAMDALRDSIDQMPAGKVTLVEDLLAKMKQVLTGKQGW
jgi:hypothetical protein